MKLNATPRFQTGGRHKTSPVSLQGKNPKMQVGQKTENIMQKCPLTDFIWLFYIQNKYCFCFKLLLHTKQVLFLLQAPSTYKTSTVFASSSFYIQNKYCFCFKLIGFVLYQCQFTLDQWRAEKGWFMFWMLLPCILTLLTASLIIQTARHKLFLLMKLKMFVCFCSPLINAGPQQALVVSF